MLQCVEHLRVDSFSGVLLTRVERLGSNAVPPRDRTLLMTAMDDVNRRYGRGSLQLANAGVGAAPRSWSMKQERKTPRYTTEWDEMPIVRA